MDKNGRMTEAEVLKYAKMKMGCYTFSPATFGDRRMTITEMTAIFDNFDAFWMYNGPPCADKPHAILKSGLHSNGFIMCKAVLENPRMCALFAGEIYKVINEKISPHELHEVGAVVSSAYSAISLGWEVARLICRSNRFDLVYKEVEKDENKNPTIIRGGIDRDNNVLVVNELMTTGGGSTLETRKAALTCNGDKPGPHVLEPAYVLVHRSKDYVLADGSAIQPIFHFDIENFKPDECPYCAVGSKAIKPKTPLTNWALLHGREV